MYSRRLHRFEQYRLSGFAGFGGTGCSQSSAAQTIKALVAERLVGVGVEPGRRLERDPARADGLDEGG
jgi:hypothetical protein